MREKFLVECCVREKFLVECCVREKFLVECFARKSYQSTSGKTEDQIIYSTQEIRAIFRINRTTSTLFRNPKAVPVGACLDIVDLNYDNDLYNRTRLNQSIESLYRNRKEATCSALIYQKFSKSHILVKKKS